MPDTLAAGSTLKVQRSYADYPADEGWVVTFYFAGAASFSAAAATADVSEHLLTISAATSATFTAGDYRWQARAVKDTETAIVEEGEIQITPNFATIGTAASDQRTYNEQVLDALKAAFLGQSTSATSEYEISSGGNSRKIKHLSKEELLAAINRYTFLVARDKRLAKNARGIKASNLIRVEMP